jgi:hypothetical protein
MGAMDESIREELIGAVLGELSLMRADVKELSRLLEANGKRFKDDSELTLLRFASRYEQFLKQFSEMSADVLIKAASFEEARDQLLGEIAIRQYDQVHEQTTKLLRNLLREERNRAISYVQLAIVTAGTAVASLAVCIGALAAFHFIRI